MLHGVRLVRLDQQARPQRVGRFGQFPNLLQQACSLIEQGHAGVIRLHGVGPDLKRGSRLAMPFQQQAQVDRGRGERRVDRQRSAISIDRRPCVAGVAELGSQIEPGTMQIWRTGRLRFDPATVERDNRRMTAAGTDGFGIGHKVTKRGCYPRLIENCHIVPAD